MEISIVGGNELIFNSHTFNSLKGFNLLRVDGAKTFVVHKQAFTNLQASSLLLQVQNCDSFIIESNAFKNMQTPISAEVNGCNLLAIQNSAFSRLQDGKFQNIKLLKLSESAFTFENQGAIGRHGPVTNLSFHSVSIPEIPKTTFLSSVAEINIHNSDIKEIHSDAFKASQISAIYLVNTSITRIQSGAFSGRTLVYNFVMRLCKVRYLESKAVLAAITNLTVQHSIITEIHSGAIDSTIANVVIEDNKINTVSTNAFIFNNWNRLNMNNNVVRTLQKSFIKPSINPEMLEFSFKGNEIYNATAGSFNFLPGIQNQIGAKFDDNFFDQVCYCDIENWLVSLLEDEDVYFILNTSYCTINDLFSRCFELPEGLINMQNFTELTCGSGNISCEPYNGATKILDTTAIMLFDETEDRNNTNLIVGLTLGALLILAVGGTVVILLIRAGIWLKRNGYCIRVRNMRLTQNEISNDDEGIMVNLEQVNKNDDQPDELTPELLLKLRADLENPETHNEARELIERLYEQFIVHDSYTNNNRQDEETHLYEELGNLQHPNNHQEARNANANGHIDNPINLIKYMEGKFNGPMSKLENKPALVVEYSEPTDAAVHLYSELKQNQNDDDSEKKSSAKSSVKSNASSKMAFRPLPDKPNDDSAPGPSSKY